MTSFMYLALTESRHSQITGLGIGVACYIYLSPGLQRDCVGEGMDPSVCGASPGLLDLVVLCFTFDHFALLAFFFLIHLFYFF